MAERAFVVGGRTPSEVDGELARHLSSVGPEELRAATQELDLGTLVVLRGRRVDELGEQLRTAVGGVVAAPPIGPRYRPPEPAAPVDPAPAPPTTAVPRVGADPDDEPAMETVRRAAPPRVRLSDGTLVPLRGRSLFGRDPQPTPGDPRPDALVSVDDPDRSVSKTHLALDARADGLWAEDLRSTNGSSVHHTDGSRTDLSPGVPFRLDLGDVVQFGAFSARVES